MPNRPSRRTLVRWNDDHDKELLLWIVYCCNESGIKIPFPRIAQCMGPAFTEGACIQHLAKIRNKMEEAGLHVPPTQKRGTVTRTGSSIYAKKPKDLPIPRVRPDTAPIETYDEDEEEPEDNLVFAVAPQSVNTGRSRFRRFKNEDSDEEDPFPEELFDSDNEYGAKKPSPKKPSKTQMKLRFGQHNDNQELDESPGSAVMQRPVSDNFQPSKGGADLKYETETDRAVASDSIETENTAAPVQGTRRKSAAMYGFDGDDADSDEYEPGKKLKSQTKKKGGRATKKQKIDSKTKDKPLTSEAKTIVSPTRVGTQEVQPYHPDRMAMPPPSMPPSTATMGFGWNDSFMNQPFGASRFRPQMYSSGNVPIGHWNDFSSSNGSFGASCVPAADNFTTNTYQPMPSYNYMSGGDMTSASSPDTRNHSFASASSTSTTETMGSSWNQPTRSPGFPNPRESSFVLNTLLNTSNADSSTHIDIFGSDGFGIKPPGTSRTEMPELMANHRAQFGMEVAPTAGDALFVEQPDEVDTNSFFAAGYYADMY